jgi:hypothetical protein
MARGEGQAPRGAQRERAIIATLADMVRASGLPKHEPGVVGKPKSEFVPENTTPALTLDDVMEPEPEESKEAVFQRIADAAKLARDAKDEPPPPPNPMIAGIVNSGRAKLDQLKLERQRAQAQRMREAKYAKQGKGAEA